MILLGQTAGLLPDPYGVLNNWLDDHLPLCDCRPTATSQSEWTQRGKNLLHVNYPELPSPKINQLVIPTGATRWSYMFMLVNEDGLAAIEAESASGPLMLSYQAETVRQTDDPSEFRPPPIKLPMWRLAAIPIGSEVVNENRVSSGNVGQNMYILPLVDGRYWWQFLHVGDICSETFSTPTALLTYLLGRLPEDVAVESLHADYDRVPDVLPNPTEPVSTVLDSVAWQLGLMVVPNLTSDQQVTTGAGDKFALLSPIVSGQILTANRAGIGGLDALGEALGVPLPMAGDDYLSVMAPESVAIDDGTGLDVRTAASASYSGPVASGTVLALRSRWIGTIPSDLVDRIAADFYLRHGYRFDITYVGTPKLQPVAFTDCLTCCQVVLPDKVLAHTRHRSLPVNTVPELGDSTDPVIVLLEDLLGTDNFLAPVGDLPTANAAFLHRQPDGSFIPNLNRKIVVRTRTEQLDFLTDTPGRWEYVLGCRQFIPLDCGGDDSSTYPSSSNIYRI